MNLTVGRPLRQIFLFAVPLVFGTIFQQLYSFADTVIVGRCLGTDALAAVGATSSLHFLILGFVQGACVGFGIPVAQNFGAGKMKRIREGIRDGLLIQIIYCAVIWVVLLAAAEPLVYIVLGETVSDVALGAQRYLFLCSCLFVFHGSLMIFRNTLQGMGYSFHAIISGVWELVGRSLGGWLAVHAAGFTAVCLANPMAWIFALGYCIVLVFYMIRKNEKRLGIYQ